MKLEKQVTSLKLSKKLKKLEVLELSEYAWVKHPGAKDFYLMTANHARGRANLLASNYGVYSAFTVAELGEMLPEFKLRKYTDKYAIHLPNNPTPHQSDKSMVNCLAKMLIRLKENKIGI